MKIVINDSFVRGSFYRSSTDNSGLYHRIYNRNVEDIILTPDKDFRFRLRSFSSKSSPIVQYRDKIVVIYPIKVETGRRRKSSIIGSASQYINVTGTIEVRTEPWENTAEPVNLFMIGEIEGIVETQPEPDLSPPLAKLGINFSVEKLGEVGEQTITHGSQTQTTGFSGDVGVGLSGGPVPGVNAKLTSGLRKETKVDATPYGKLYIPVNKNAWIPVNTPLVWKLVVEMQAKNYGNARNITSATAYLKNVHVTFSIPPIGKHGTGYSPTRGGFFNNVFFLFAPSSPLNKFFGETWTEKDYQNLIQLLSNPNYAPKLRHIVRDNEFVQDDEMLDATLFFSGFNFRKNGSRNEKFIFDDAELNFLDSKNLERIGHAIVTNVVADLKKETFSGQFRNMQFSDHLLSGSKYARSLMESNGVIYFDPDIIEATRSFTKNAITEIPYFNKLTVGKRERNKRLAAKAQEGEEERERELAPA